MNTWWKEIETGSHRDQLSFSYALWKTKNVKIEFFNKYIYKSEYFNWDGNHIQGEKKNNLSIVSKPYKIKSPIPKAEKQTKDNTTIKIINKPTVIKTLEPYKLPVKTITRKY